MTQKRILHLLNGQSMYDFFKSTDFLGEELMIPFNEAICYGDTCSEIFSDSFTQIRAKAHHVSPQQYIERVLKPLKPLFHENFIGISLWFDEDMFCQINILNYSCLARQTDYKGGNKLH